MTLKRIERAKRQGPGLRSRGRKLRALVNWPDAIFLRRALFVALAASASALAGVGLKTLAPAAIVANSEAMIRLVVTLEATLLALVLGFLISICYGRFSAQQEQWQAIGGAVMTLNRLLLEIDTDPDSARETLVQILQRMRERF